MINMLTRCFQLSEIGSTGLVVLELCTISYQVSLKVALPRIRILIFNPFTDRENDMHLLREYIVKWGGTL